MPKISVTVITKNEAHNLAAALASVAFADEIVIVDAESTDDTVRVAQRFTDRVLVRAWPGYVDQKNYAASMASHDWILSLDADERVTPELAAEIRSVMSRDPAQAVFRMPRAAWYLGRWIRTTDWYPDRKPRLYDRRRARWTGKYVHETLAADGPIGDLRGELQHFPYKGIDDHLETINRYTRAAADQLHEDGARAGMAQCLLHPPLAFFRNYILKGGIRDGTAGFVISVMNAYYVFLKFAKLWELEQRRLQP
ncbi:MAG TPA: glycosyltransferase family 2 protein [Vicinamibacterales bacterium]|nr:glycosyltransferase family 2 protein [Vicinamibacterales bacterium]